MRIRLICFFLAIVAIQSFAKIYPHDPQKQFLIVLDAGHGGKDAGAVGSVNSNMEKDINLAITLEVGRLLEANQPNIKVIYTRKEDVFVELGRRAQIANQAKADLFVSIHTNAIDRDPNRQPVGVQTYTLSLNTANTNLEVEKRENSVIKYERNGERKYHYSSLPENDIMFEIMQDRDMKESVRFAKMCQKQMVNYAGRKDMGVKQANLLVLRQTYMPSVLIEVGFISTDSEEKFLMSKEGRNKMAMAIYKAIVEYYKSCV